MEPTFGTNRQYGEPETHGSTSGYRSRAIGTQGFVDSNIGQNNGDCHTPHQEADNAFELRHPSEDHGTLSRHAPTTFTFKGRTFKESESVQHTRKTDKAKVRPRRLFQETINERDPESVMTESGKLRSAKLRNKDDLAKGEFFKGATTEYPNYDVNPELEPPVLRSYPWVTYVKGEGQTFAGGVREFITRLVKYASKIGFQQ